MRALILTFLAIVAVQLVVAPPVDQKKKDDEDKKGTSEELDDFGLEYGRYLQQVVQALEEDKEFAKKLENVSAEQIKSGHIAKELEFVKHNVRSKLDELKRMEVDRLRKLIREQMERTELGLYRDEDGHLLNSPDGRRWRTIPNHRSGFEGGVGDGNFWLGLNRKGVKIPKHLDIENPHSFEIEDLKKLIQTATKDLEEIDRQRREEFKKYELEKEAKYRESLRNMTEEQRKETEKHHQEMIQKHKDHPKVHHPGSKPQLEQVWEDQDHMPREEFNPRTFFAMHDVNGDGHLDVEEVEAILLPEVKKLYNPNNEEDDPAEMEEEFHRMREHIFNETDKNKDGLISLEEFLKMTEQPDFPNDEGWRDLGEQAVYSEAELEEYMRQRQMQMLHQQQYPQYYGDQRMYYDVGNAQQGLPPQINYQVPPGGVPPHPGYPSQKFQQEHPQQQFQQGHPQLHFQQGHPQQQFQQGHPQQQFQQGHPQQQFQQGHPQQQFQQGHPQQQFQQGHSQQQFQQGHPQQQFQQGHPEPQFQQGHPPNIQYQSPPQLQQFQQGYPQQQQRLPPQQENPQQPLQQAQVQQDAPQEQKVKQAAGVLPQQAASVNKKPSEKSNLNPNQIPNSDAKPVVPQDGAAQAAAQQVPPKN
ncbi:nucleobindin-2-like isoform X2 [Stegodyphus dumicola]|nr:nucleobindin-2-like isoform X2 [Stegodyphus dumicola]